MRLHWMRDRVTRGIYSAQGTNTNLATYPTTPHSPTHHLAVRPIYTYQGDQSPAAMQGGANILKTLATTRQPVAKASQHSPGREPNSRRDHGTLSGPTSAQTLTRKITPQMKSTKRARNSTALAPLRPAAPHTSTRPQDSATSSPPPSAERTWRGRTYSLQGACPRQRALTALRASRLQYNIPLPPRSSHSPGSEFPTASTDSQPLPPQ